MSNKFVTQFCGWFTILTYWGLDKLANIFKCIFLNENHYILNNISQKFVPQGTTNNESALIQVMDWYQSGNKPFLEPQLPQFYNIIWHH